MENIQNFLNGKIWSVLNRLEKQSKLEKSHNFDIPTNDRMLAISQDTGVFFNIMLKTMKAKKVLEIGTSVGYSTLWFADAIKQNSQDINEKLIVTIDENPSKIERAKRNFGDANVDDIIEIKEGRALDILRKILHDYEENGKVQADQLDFVFIDADKETLIEYFDTVFLMVREGGIIAADNMLYPEEYRPIMEKYAHYVRSKPNVQSVTLPIGNGEEFTIKIQ